MSKTTNIIIAIVAVVVIAGGGVLLFGNKDTSNSDINTGSTADTADTTEAEVAATVTYTNDGFSPASVTVPSGSALRIVNNSDEAVGPRSDPHPAHNLNPELNFSDIEPGQSATMVLTEQGTWGYHNTLKEDHRGTVTVE